MVGKNKKKRIQKTRANEQESNNERCTRPNVHPDCSNRETFCKLRDGENTKKKEQEKKMDEVSDWRGRRQ